MCDLTYLRTWVGFAYLALVIDVYSRRIVGWALTTHLRTELALEALEMAIWTRNQRLDGLVHHSDAGSQYLAIRYTDALAGAGALPSVGSVGDSYDNALAESTIGQIKAELIHAAARGAPSSSSSTPCSNTSTGGTTAACTARPACAPRPRPRPPTTLNPGHMTEASSQ